MKGLLVAILAALVVLVVLVGADIRVDPFGDDGGGKSCPKRSSTDLGPSGKAKWRLTKPHGAKLAIELDYHVGTPRTAGTHVGVRRVKGGRGRGTLPRDAVTGAFLLDGRLSDGSHGTQFRPVVTARRARDGRSVRVELASSVPLGDRRASRVVTRALCGSRVRACARAMCPLS